MTLTEAWENAGRPRPPFYYIFEHPDPEYSKLEKVRKVIILSSKTHFEDTAGEFDGAMISVRKLMTHDQVSTIGKTICAHGMDTAYRCFLCQPTGLTS
jgi:hypothetical protein